MLLPGSVLVKPDIGELASENTGGGKFESSVKSKMESLSGVSGGGKLVKSGKRGGCTQCTVTKKNVSF